MNLLMNRASPWADINSHIPCSGQVDVTAKAACELALRRPEWTTPEECTCTLNGTPVAPQWEGRYAVVQTQQGDTVSLCFPIAERTETLHLQNRDFTAVVRGNEIVDLSPPGEHCPLFLKPHLRQDEPQWREVERFVADEVTMDF